MIPPLAAHHRVVAPDFVGFGRSDKHTEIPEYFVSDAPRRAGRFYRASLICGTSLVGQDWGILGLPIQTEMPERFACLVS
jgi:haloalkane dehalogenase